MKIKSVEAYWLRCPIPEGKRWRSDYGHLQFFDMALVVVKDEHGNEGYGEAKAAVGATGACASIVSCIEHELAPRIIGKPADDITGLWEDMYNGSRDHYARKRGRVFPVLGNRGLTISAMSGIDMALWDLKGKKLGIPVVDLIGGACRNDMPCYASGGWADEEGIGEQLAGYVERGFTAVKMRIGVMDGTVAKSVRRVAAARSALGPEIDIMADAHGTFNVPEAKRFCREAEPYNLYWIEEPVSSDDKKGCAEVRKHALTPIAAGESEFTRFDFRDLLDLDAVDVLQPDAAIVGGITESVRISALAATYQKELAPHCWGSALSFMAGVSIAFASPSAVYIEFSLGGNPLMYDLVNEAVDVVQGRISRPSRPGLGFTLSRDFINEFSVST